MNRWIVWLPFFALPMPGQEASSRPPNVVVIMAEDFSEVKMITVILPFDRLTAISLVFAALLASGE